MPDREREAMVDREVARAAIRDGYAQGYQDALRAIEDQVGALASTVDAGALRSALKRRFRHDGVSYHYDGHPGDEGTIVTLLMHGVALGPVPRSTIYGNGDDSTEEHRETYERAQLARDLARDAGSRS